MNYKRAQERLLFAVMMLLGFMIGGTAGVLLDLAMTPRPSSLPSNIIVVRPGQVVVGAPARGQ